MKNKSTLWIAQTKLILVKENKFMLLQPCGKCGTLLKESEPMFTKTVKISEGKYEPLTLCQRCYSAITESNNEAKLLVEG